VLWAASVGAIIATGPTTARYTAPSTTPASARIVASSGGRADTAVVFFPVSSVVRPRARLYTYDVPLDQVGRDHLFGSLIQVLPADIRALAFLTTLESQGATFIMAQGGYERFRTNGVYDPAKMDAFIRSYRGIASVLEPRVARGVILGVQALDDFAGAQHWPPSGLGITEVERIVALWKAEYPWLPVYIRGRPRQFPRKVAKLDGFIAQYRYWGGLGTPEEFQAAELALASSWGIPVMFALNFLDGGSAGPGTPMTAAEVRRAAQAFARTPAQWHLGLGGWKYDQFWVANPDVRAALLEMKAGIP
jgi:hypothetical protein